MYIDFLVFFNAKYEFEVIFEIRDFFIFLLNAALAPFLKQITYFFIYI